MASILLIDDSPTVFVSVKNAFHRDGHEVHRLISPMELPRYLRDTRTDVILLDLQMPEFSGFSVGVLLLAYDHRRTPIILYSARPRDEIEVVARKIQAVGVMEKARPVSELRSLVHQVLDQHPLQV